MALMGGARVRLRDVADRAGVSSTTASLILGGRDVRVSAKTRQRVLRAAQEMDYQPNLTARSLRTQISHTIGLLADTIVTGHYGGEMVRGGLTAALEHGHRLLVCETKGDADLEGQLIEDLVARQVDGFVYVTASHDRVVVPTALAGQRTVLLNCEAGPEVPAVVPDEEQGGRAAAALVASAGHDRGIVLVGETPALSLPAAGRLAGLVAGFAEAGIALDDQYDCRWWPEDAFAATAAALAAGPVPRVLVCLNDRIALGVYQALGEAGLTVPAEVAVVSFDDSDLAGWLRPALTSVALPEFAMGRLAVEMLLADAEPAGAHRVPMQVRVRGSL